MQQPRRQRVGPSSSHGARHDLGRDFKPKAVGIEHHVEVVRISRVGPVHRPVEMGAAAVELSSGPSGGTRRNAHPLRHSLRGP